MDWYPLKLTTPVEPHVFGGRSIPEKWGRGGLPGGRIGETWEVSDVGGEMTGEVINGPLAGQSLRQLVEKHPEELMGRGWRGEYFPVLAKFIDAEGMLPMIGLPSHVLVARKDGVFPWQGPAHVGEAIPGAETVFFEESSHALFLDEPEKFNETVRRFVDS